MPGNFDSLNPASDDVLNMARAAGYLPAADSTAATDSPGSDPTQNGGIISPSGTSAPGYVDPSAGTTTVPSLTPQEESQISIDPKPGQTVKEGSSSSSKYSGTNVAKFGQIRSATSPTLQRDLNSADASAQAEGQVQVDAFGNARNENATAQAAVAKAKVDEITADGIQAQFLGKIQDGFAAKEAQINEEERGNSNRAKADYMAALADLRASRVDPSQIWGAMSGGQRFGTLVTAFAQDFLGARGVHTSAMETFNKAIDRNIDSQIQAIKTKGEVADGFKSLWYMQRSQSNSDQEARTRVRGFLLEGAKQAVASNMAQYQAGLASAQGQAAIAAIDQEFAKNLVDVYSHVDANSNARRQQAIQVWGDQLKASLESQANSIAQQRLNMDKKNQQVNPLQDLMFDPETGKAIGVFQPGLKDTEKEQYRKDQATTTDAVKAFGELRQLIHEGVITPDMLKGTRFENTAQKRYDALAVRIGHFQAKASDGRPTDADVQEYLKGIPTNTWLSQADTDQVLADTQGSVINSFKNKFQTYGYDLPPDDPRRGVTAGTAEPFHGGATDARNTVNPPPQSIEHGWIKDAEKNLGGPDASGAAGKLAREPAPTVSSDLKEDHDRFRKENPDLKVSAEAPGVAGHMMGPHHVPIGDTPEQWEQSLTHLKEIASSDSSSPDDKDAAIKQLQIQASGITTNSDDPTAIYAIMMLHDLNTGYQRPGYENITPDQAVVHETVPPVPAKAKKK